MAWLPLLRVGDTPALLTATLRACLALEIPRPSVTFSAMIFPRFWAKGSHSGFVRWGWSDSSLAEAAALAQEGARKVAEGFAAVGRPDRRYGYADRPLREPVLRELRTSEGELAAVVTRNSYGCLVLNTVRVMFVDVDLPEPESGRASGLSDQMAEVRPARATM
jgi:hypothetical protein